ncbi:MAG: peptide deformylase [Candidatus Taylorbacteria bacterium]|nr:peptide deformylase [Candidatus Taylorbacteria bacterium]
MNTLKHDYGKDIVQNGHEALREEAHPVPIKEISSRHIQNLIKKMKSALATQSDGVGLAAAQVGEPLRIFIISKRVFEGRADAPKDDMVFINPEILKLSRDKDWLEEGCLSVRPLFGKVRRSKKATISAHDEHGQKFEMGASGLIAQIFQHEVDHLHGVLFIDKAKEVIEVPMPVSN